MRHVGTKMYTNNLLKNTQILKNSLGTWSFSTCTANIEQ